MHSASGGTDNNLRPAPSISSLLRLPSEQETQRKYYNHRRLFAANQVPQRSAELQVALLLNPGLFAFYSPHRLDQSIEVLDRVVVSPAQRFAVFSRLLNYDRLVLSIILRLAEFLTGKNEGRGPKVPADLVAKAINWNIP